MAIETLHVRESLVPGLSAADLERQSFYELLLDRYGIDIVGGVADDRAHGDERDESEALGVPLHSPAFVFERTTRSSAGEIVEYVRSIYRGDRYRLVTELNRRSRAATARQRRAPALTHRWSVPNCRLTDVPAAAWLRAPHRCRMNTGVQARSERQSLEYKVVLTTW